MTTQLKPLICAWQFLTAVPVSRACHDPAPDELAGSMAWYPLVGVLLGALLAMCNIVLARWLPREAVAALLILLLVVVTRGLHQDGLADTIDGIAGGRTPSDRLTIMRDPRIGAVGATGLFLSLLLRYAALVSVPVTWQGPILLCMPAIGRWSMVVGAYGAAYARAEGGLAAPFLAHLCGKHVLGATVAVLCLFVWAFGLVAAFGAVIVGGLVSKLATTFYRSLLGGITGDTLGATNEVIEVMFVLFMPLLLTLS